MYSLYIRKDTLKEGTAMHVLAISTISDSDKFWDSLKKAHGRLPKGAKWVLAVASADGTKAVNVVVADSVDDVRALFEEDARPFATTEYLEADSANAVGLAK
jgi:hypothetical protein